MQFSTLAMAHFRFENQPSGAVQRQRAVRESGNRDQTQAMFEYMRSLPDYEAVYGVEDSVFGSCFVFHVRAMRLPFSVRYGILDDTSSTNMFRLPLFVVLTAKIKFSHIHS
jgi:hypothetical protein